MPYRLALLATFLMSGASDIQATGSLSLWGVFPQRRDDGDDRT
jgi:hypothetical protein